MNASGKIYRIFFFVCFCIRVDGWWWWMCRQGIVMCSLLFRCDKKRHTFFTLFNAISVSNVFCSCLVVHERGQTNIDTRETRNLSKFQTTNGTWVCRCQWKIMHSHFVVVRIDEHDESRSTLEWSIWVLELVVRTVSIATRSCVICDKKIENVRIFLSHLFPFVRLCAFVGLCIGPFDYLQCIKCLTKESPRVPRDHWECCTKC